MNHWLQNSGRTGAIAMVSLHQRFVSIMHSGFIIKSVVETRAYQLVFFQRAYLLFYFSEEGLSVVLFL